MTYHPEDISSWLRQQLNLDRVRAGRNHPVFSIVIPSFQQGEFLEDCIKSVLLQDFDGVELIVMDGGSTDSTINILRRYENEISYESHPDGGQSAAINEGFNKARGEIFGWLCSDDILWPDALKAVFQAHQARPDAAAWVGSAFEFDLKGNWFGPRPPKIGKGPGFGVWDIEEWICQPSCFFSRKSFLAAGMLDPDLHYAMDLDLWINLRKLGEFITIPSTIGCSRIYPDTKTNRNPAARLAEYIHVYHRSGNSESATRTLIDYAERHAPLEVALKRLDSNGGILSMIFRQITPSGKGENRMKRILNLCKVTLRRTGRTLKDCLCR